MILVIAEQRDGTLNRATWEAVVAAQQLAGGGAGDDAVTIAVLGASAASASQELAAAGVGDVLVLADPALEPYTPDAYAMALAQVIASTSPRIVALPHTYQTRDFAPALAASSAPRAISAGSRPTSWTTIRGRPSPTAARRTTSGRPRANSAEATISVAT